MSSAKTAIILLIVTVIVFGFYAYMLSSPITYGVSYTIEVICGLVVLALAVLTVTSFKLSRKAKTEAAQPDLQ